MTRLRALFQAIQQILHIFGMILSPMVALLVIIGVITILEAIGKHTRFLEQLENNGVVTTAVLFQPSDYGNGSWMAQTKSANGEDMWIFLRTEYYPPEVLDTFAQGLTVTVRYDANTDGVLEEYYPALQNYLGYLKEPALITLISWLIVIWHPEFLYINMPGFIDAFNRVWKFRFRAKQ